MSKIKYTPTGVIHFQHKLTFSPKTNHHGISDLIRNAIVTQNGKLTSRFKYLNKYL